MDADELFVRTLGDLDARTRAADEYEALMSVALLRKLLLDGHPLMDQVYATRRLKVRFRFNGVTAFEQMVLQDRPQWWLIGDALKPDVFNHPSTNAPVDGTRDHFLARQVMILWGQPVTVRDLIDYLAHVAGGVHMGAPRDVRHKVLAEVQRRVFVHDLSGGVRHVQLIGEITVRGLTPLRDAVLADISGTNRQPSE